MLFQVSYERLMQEVKLENIEAGQKDSLELEDLGDAWAYYLSSIDRPKTYVFVVLKSELTQIQILNLAPISRLVDRRITESLQLSSIAKSLKRLEDNLQPRQEKIVERIIETTSTE